MIAAVAFALLIAGWAALSVYMHRADRRVEVKPFVRGCEIPLRPEVLDFIDRMNGVQQAFGAAATAIGDASAAFRRFSAACTATEDAQS